MTKGTTSRIILATLLIGATGTAAVWGIPQVFADLTAELTRQDRTTQEIASGVAIALDRGVVSWLRGDLTHLLEGHRDVRAIEIVPHDHSDPIGIGDVALLRSQSAAGSSECREIMLLRSGERWGVVRVLFKATAHRSLLHPSNPSFWALIGLATVVLPLGVAVLDRIRRRRDRSEGGAMAVAADRARHTLDTLAECVLLLDADARITYANRAFCETASTSDVETVGKAIGDLDWVMAEDRIEPAQLPWDTAVRDGTPVRGVRLGLRSATGECVFIVNCTPLYQKRSVLHGVLVTLDNVTELERGRHALQEARDAAEHANEAKSRFLAMMSHEIRTPLNGVCGSLQLLKKTGMDDRQARYAQAAMFSASTLLHLINDILDFSKIEAGRLEMSPVEFDFEECVDATMLMMVPAARAKGLDLAYDIAPGVADRFNADPDRIRQVIINLTNNAIKFTERGSVTLRIAVEHELDGKQLLRCAVADTGIGIPDSKLHQLFKAFSQVDSSTSRRYGGTGLGLVISEQLCKLMGGRIEVASTEGQGTTFTFFVELSMAPSAPVEPLSNPPDTLVLVGLHELETRLARRALAMAEDRVVVCEDVEGLAHQLRLTPGLHHDRVVVVVSAPPGELAATTRNFRAQFPGSNHRIIPAAYASDPQAPIGDRTLDTVLQRPLGTGRLLALLREEGLEPRHAATRLSDGLDLSGIRVLLAEDNPVGQMVVSDMLRTAGAECDTANDGHEVLAALGHRQYDVILMDCFMPSLDGFETSRRIREMERSGRITHRTPIVALTAKAMRGDRDDCLRAGMDGYLTKPIDEGKLLREVASRAGRDPGQRTDSSSPPASKGLDTDELLGRFAGKASVLRQLIEAFHTASAEDLGRIEAALAAKDAHALEHAAHRLAGGAGFVAAHDLHRRAKELEQLGSNGQIADLETLAAELRQEATTVVAALDQLADTLSSPMSSRSKESTP